MAGSKDLSEQYKVEAKPLTDWANEPTIEDLKADYMEALSHHNTHTVKVRKWLDNLNVTGSAVIKKVPGRSTLVPKLIRKQAEWRYSALSETFLSNEDIFQTEPVTYEDRKAAVQNGLILNQQFNTQIDKVNFIDEYVRAAVDEGSVVVRVGWDFEEESVLVPNMVVTPVQDPMMGQMLMQGMQMMMQDPAAAEQMPKDLRSAIETSLKAGYPAVLVEDGMKEEMRTIRNQPTVECCEYTQVILDPTCKGDLTKDTFVIFAFETSLSKLRKDKKYKNLDSINVETNAIQNEPQGGRYETTTFNFKDAPRKKFIAYEYWGMWDKDNSGTTKPFVATWVGDTIIRMEDSPFPDGGVPFVLVQYLPKRKSVYGEPDGELLADNQAIAGAVTRGLMDIMGRSAAGQKGVRQDALDITNMRKFENGQDYKFNAHIDPRQAIYDHVYPEIPNSAQFMLNLQNAEAESLTGVKAYTGGISGESLGKVASAARSALDAASKRELGILRRLAKGLVAVGRKITAMNAIFLSEEEVVRVSNAEFVPIKRDDLSGKIDIKLQISTAETDNAKAEELSFMLQTMGNSMPPEMSQLILTNIARLRKMPELAKQLQDYKPQPDPLAQRIKELEAAKLEAEIEKLKSETAENYAEAQLNGARSRSEVSKADKTDLDYLEQAEGVTQERELQKGQAQAYGNIALEKAKAQLNPKGGTSAKSG